MGAERGGTGRAGLSTSDAAVVLGCGRLFARRGSEASYPLNGSLVGAGAITP